MSRGVVDVLIGLQWGDEGKGKIVDTLANEYDMVARFQGGPNAGHTIIVEGKTLVLHTVPSGILHEHPVNLIGNGVVLDPITFKEEIKNLSQYRSDVSSKLYISKKAHIILPTHRVLDEASEAAKGKEKIGSTLRGIGPAYMDKTGRNGLRIGDVLSPTFKDKYERLKEKHLGLLKAYTHEYDLKSIEQKWWEGIEFIRKMNLVDCEYLVNEYIESGKRVLAEGAQGAMLDIDFGTYPYVTSSNTVTAAVCTGLGLAPQRIGEVIGISKAYTTRVGSGPFPTELTDATGDTLRKAGNEFGATTGRPRRCGWIDIPALRYSIMLNGVTQLVLTKIDVLEGFPQIKAAESYLLNGVPIRELPYDLNDGSLEPVYKSFEAWDSFDPNGALPEALTNYLDWLERELNTTISTLSTGPSRDQLIRLPLADTITP